MADRMEDADDMQFEELFSALDSITASDELKSSTLDAIFGSASEMNANAVPAKINQDEKVIRFPKKGKHFKKNNRRPIRIAGIAACVALFGLGTVGYTMPTSYASMEDGDTTFTFGINSLGMTVSATADSAQGNELIAESGVSNKDYRDAVGTVASAIADTSAGTGADQKKSITLSVTSDDSNQRASVKKGSSEAIEISGFKKAAPIAKADSSSATSEETERASGEAGNSEQQDSDAEEVTSFEVNTEEKATETKDQTPSSDDQVSKYHPLVDNNADDDEDATEDSESATEEAAPAQD